MKTLTYIAYFIAFIMLFVFSSLLYLSLSHYIALIITIVITLCYFLMLRNLLESVEEKENGEIFKSFNEEMERKIEFAEAIIEEAKFNEIYINLDDKMEHQLGTVWIGDVSIQSSVYIGELDEEEQ